MYITHLNSIYSEDTTLIDYVQYPQYIHQVSDGGMRVSLGVKILPSEFVEYLLAGTNGAITSSMDELKALPTRRTGLILSTGGSVWTGYGTTIPLTDKYPKHRMLPLGMTQIYAGQLANKLGGTEYVSTDSTSCISAHAALFQANTLIKSGVLDRVIVVASDNGASEEYMSFFGENKLCLLANEEGKAQKFRLGQGANITVLESEESINVTGNMPIAQLHDISIVAETHTNPLGITTTGDGYKRVISNVLDTHHGHLDYVKTHSTYSKDNQIEQAVITETLGDIKTVNYKSRIGHIMGPSTGVEMHMSIMELGGTFLSLGAGMGNVFSAAIVESL